MDILNAHVKEKKIATDVGLIQAVVTLRVRDSLRPAPFDVDVMSFAPLELANMPDKLDQHLLQTAIEAA